MLGRLVADDMHGAWTKHIFDARSWNEVRVLAGAVRFKLRDAGMQWPAWDSFVAGDTLPDCGMIAPSDIKNI